MATVKPRRSTVPYLNVGLSPTIFALPSICTGRPRIAVILSIDKKSHTVGLTVSDLLDPYAQRQFKTESWVQHEAVTLMNNDLAVELRPSRSIQPAFN
jgi:hypothetical protein